MNYIENIYICLAAPLMVAVLCLESYRRRIIIFMLSGMTMCLLSSYINTFLAAGRNPRARKAGHKIHPGEPCGRSDEAAAGHILSFGI